MARAEEPKDEREGRAAATHAAFATMLRERARPNEPPELFPCYFELLRPSEFPALVRLVGQLVVNLDAIEQGPGDAKARAQSMRRLLIRLRFVVRRAPRRVRDGTDYLLRLGTGDTPEEALRQMAKASGRKLEAVRKNVDRFVKTARMRPYFRVPQARDLE